MVDVRDIADVAVAELLRRDHAASPLPRLTLDLAGPDQLTGESVSAIWSAALRREVRYGGSDLQAFEAQMAGWAPGWMAYDMRLMMACIQQHGMKGSEESAQRVQALLGRPMRRYQDLVNELVQATR